MAMPPLPEQFPPDPPSSRTDSHKRKDQPSKTSNKPSKKVRRVGPKQDPKPDLTPNGDGNNDGESSKPKRVRTGCLTCRERHLKCDEALPSCHNCRKSNRDCKRGIKLNFIDTWVDRPPNTASLYGTPDWKVEFLDESRDIASEYVGTTHKYRPLDQDTPAAMQHDQNTSYNFAANAPPAPGMGHQALPPIHGILPDHYTDPSNQPDMANVFEAQAAKRNAPYSAMQPPRLPNAGPSSQGQYTPSSNGVVQPAHVGYKSAEHQSGEEENEKRDYLTTAEDTLFLQVFVEEVGLWMDSMDPQKHFSRLLPFHALSEPMLLNAFLACGARHLTLVNPAYTVDKALHYYNTATHHLLKNLQNPRRDTVICATTAVILNVYEVMSEKALQRMNHIAGARALIKECGWNARATGIGAACFWLNVGLEVLSCLHFNWQVAWDPDDWGLDMDLSREVNSCMEETWTHRMLYIVGKVANFRATIPRDTLADRRAQQIRKQQRYEEWTQLKALADAWNDGTPRTMHAMAYVPSDQTSSKSAFPEIWLVKRTTTVARLFFHTAMLLLSQINPYFGVEGNNEMAELQSRHSQTICGIVAHVKDRGVASVAIRSLAHAAEVLTDRRQQEEVLEIFEKIHKETGWKIGFVYKELKEKWGWDEEPSPQQYAQTHEAARKAQEAQEAQQQQQLQQQAQAAQQSLQLQQGFDFGTAQQGNNMAFSSPARSVGSSGSSSGSERKNIPSGIPNPLYAKADFSLPQHPYQNFYVAPSSGFGHPQTGHAWWGS